MINTGHTGGGAVVFSAPGEQESFYFLLNRQTRINDNINTDVWDEKIFVLVAALFKDYKLKTLLVINRN